MKILDVPQSGSQGGITSSRNQFGQYRRTRAVPVQPRTTAQLNQRARQSNNAAAWRGLTDAQRLGWKGLGLDMVRTDALGQSYHLTGFQAYCSVNNNNLLAGNAVVSDAPVITDPGSLATGVLTLTNASVSLAYTATPLAAGVRLFSYASAQRSAGRSFEADLRFIAVSAAAAASPADLLAAYTAKWGAPVTGKRIFFAFALYHAGFLGRPFGINQVVA